MPASQTGLRRMRQIIAAGCCILLGSLLAACGGDDEPEPSRTGKPVDGQQLLRVGTNLWIGYEPLYYAEHLGLHQSAPIRLLQLPSASHAMQALRSGALDAAALTLDEVLRLLQDGIELQIVLVLDTSHGGDAIIAHPGITSLADLQGRRIGVENTAVGAIMLAGAMEAGDLRSDGLRLVRLTVDEHEGAFLREDVDAVVTFEPTRTRLLAAGGRQLYDSSQIPNRIVDVLVVTTQAVRRDPEPVRRLLAAHFRTLARMQAEPDAAATWLAARLGIDVAQVDEVLAGIRIPTLAENRQLLDADADDNLLTTVRQLTDIMLSHQMLRHPPPTDGLLTADLLPAVANDAGQ